MLCGIFVGGAARRMEGIAKGLLVTPTGEPVVVRLATLARSAQLEPAWVGMRESPHAEAYRAAIPGLREIDDAPHGVGPLGGLGGLLDAAADGAAIALACDMPFVSAQTLLRLRDEHTNAAVLAPRRGDWWEPLCARYHAPSVLPALREGLANDTRSFQRLFAALAVVQLELADPDELRDWDHPTDIAR